MSNSIITSPRNVRVTRQTRYALAGSRHRKRYPITITRPNGEVEVIEVNRKKRGKVKHKPARVSKPEAIEAPALSLFNSDYRERLASLGGYEPESYL